MTHTHTHVSRAVLAVGAFVMTVGLLSSESRAQAPRFRITPLVKLGFNPIADSVGTIGINNKGQVVYGYQPDGDDVHAWLWLPECDYGLAAGFHDLHDLDEFPEPSIARDIYESGVIVGQADGYAVGAGNGAVWECAGEDCEEGEVDYTALGMWTTQSMAAWSGAWAVSDASPNVTIVGVSRIFDVCDCEQISDLDVNRGFYLSFPASTTPLQLGLGPDTYSDATDVNTPKGENPLLISGFTDCSGAANDPRAEPEGASFCEEGSTCRPPMDAVVWENLSRTVLDDLGDNGSRARDLNDNEEIVGWAWSGSNPSSCTMRAVYWPDSVTSGVDLGATMPSGQSTNGSRAEAINSLDPPQVVGWNRDAPVALLWEDVDTTPVVTDLNDAIGCADRWIVQEAHDINDNGWIVARADDDYGSTGLYAVLLTPVPECPTDMDQDGCVNNEELDAVTENWGDCPVGVICIWDFDFDCAVEVDDYVRVILDWGCPGCGASLVGGDPPTLAEMIEHILASPLDSETKAEVIEHLISIFG